MSIALGLLLWAIIFAVPLLWLALLRYVSTERDGTVTHAGRILRATLPS